jgi:hypothetical protein
MNEHTTRVCTACGASYEAKTPNARFCVPCSRDKRVSSGQKHLRIDTAAVNRRIAAMALREPGNTLTAADIAAICAAADKWTGPENWEGVE